MVPTLGLCIIDKRVRPAADRLRVSHQQATALIASVINNSVGDPDSISTFTAWWARAAAREKGASAIKENFTFTSGQIKFNGKLLRDLDGDFEKVTCSERVTFDFSSL